MKLVQLLLPPETPAELSIHSKFLNDNPNPTGKIWEKLVKMHKERANGTDMFPKLLSVIKACYKKWGHNQQVKQCEQWAGEPSNEPIGKLLGMKTKAHSAQPMAGNEQNATQDNLMTDMILEAVGDSDQIMVAPAGPATEMWTLVPLMTAHWQKSCVWDKTIARETQWCANWSHCQEHAASCEGWKFVFLQAPKPSKINAAQHRWCQSLGEEEKQKCKQDHSAKRCHDQKKQQEVLKKMKLF